jgi:metal-dependent amidase/aminoacylase/carboxypeptidase family protein
MYAETELGTQLVRWRRHLHQHPETGFNEHRTADYVAAALESMGLQVHRGIGGTGLVASLRAGTGAGVIGLRADMDALAMTEQAPGARTSRKTPAACMAAATTATWPCCWARRACWASAATSAARCASSSSRPNTAAARRP